MSTVSVNGITVGFDDEGDGDPLVLVHGHPFDRSMWRPQVEHFGRPAWRVIAPDLRGYGETTVVPGKTTLETFARDVVALLDRLEVGRVVLGGLSMGGQVQLVDAIIEKKRIGSAFVRNRTRAKEPAFVAMWEQRGGEAGDARIVEWFEANREVFLEALNG